jgi:hypothetical protein
MSLGILAGACWDLQPVDQAVGLLLTSLPEKERLQRQYKPANASRRPAWEASIGGQNQAEVSPSLLAVVAIESEEIGHVLGHHRSPLILGGFEEGRIIHLGQVGLFARRDHVVTPPPQLARDLRREHRIEEKIQ